MSRYPKKPPKQNSQGDMWITGTIVEILPLKEMSERFHIVEFILEEGYAKEPIKFHVANKRIELLNHFREGDQVKIYFTPRGRKWVRPSDGQTVYFTDLEAWQITKF